MKAQRVIAFYPELAKELGSINAAILYQQLYYWSDKGSREDGFIYKTVAEIEYETTLSLKQQRLARTILVDKGFLDAKFEVICGKKNPTWHYKPLVEIEVTWTKGQQGVSQRATGCVPKGNDSIQEITHKTTQEDSSASLSLKNLNTNTIREAGFKKFWELYPKKSGKKPAEASWRKVDPKDYEKVFKALIRHRKTEQWTKNNGQFIPNATTWLNQERWDDEVTGISERKEYIL